MSQSAIDYYTNLLIIQYNNQQKAKATISLIVKELLCDDVMFMLRDSFNIETATGKQLDKIGQWVGIDRYFKGQTFDFTNGYFGLTDSSGTDNGQEGFSIYSDYTTKTGEMLQFGDVASANQILGDDDFKKLIKFKIILNNCNFSQKAIDDLIFDYFSGDIFLTTANDASLFYFVSNDIRGLVDILIQKNLFPKPMGVSASIIPTSQPIFGLLSYGDDVAQATNDNLITGFSTYADYTSKQGEMLTYDKVLNA